MNHNLINLIKEKSAEIFDKVKGYREHIHANPELSYQEFKTMEYVSSILTTLNIEHQSEVGKTGVVGIIRADHHDENTPCIALRADLDALPIIEKNDVPYKSKVEGVMHACGHDVHTSILLGAAEIIQLHRNELPQPVKLVFQPGEEKNPGGATYMIEDGVLKNPVVKEMIALHVFPDMEVGELGFKDGLYMASCDEIYVTINGKGGHGATPHKCIDPILIGANIVTKLQEIVSRKCDPTIPCVLSFGHFESLGATNIIPATASLKGTFRTMNEAWRKEALEIIKKGIEKIAEASGGTADVTISKGYPFLMNDEKVTSKIRSKAQELHGANNINDLPIRMTSEDFSFYSQEVPVCFYRLGVRNEAKGIIHGVHHPNFNIDDEALRIGVETMAYAPF